MAAPPLPIFRPGEELIDDRGEGLVARVGSKAFDCLIWRRQPDQKKISPTHKRAWIGSRTRAESLCGKPGSDELVDGVLMSLDACSRRHRVERNGLKRPVLAGLFQSHRGELCCAGQCSARQRGHSPRIRRPHLDPFGNQGNLVVTQLAIRRHLQAFACVANGPNEQARIRVTRNDDAAAVAPGLPTRQ